MTARLTIDGREVEAAVGTTILQAAAEAGIVIPSLCHDTRIKPLGVCRVCVVEVEGARTLTASCAAPARDGMAVRTDTPRVREARRTTLELLLADVAGGARAVRGTAFGKLLEDYGVAKSDFAPGRRRMRADRRGPLFTQDYDKCVLCRRCIETCRQRVGRHVAGLTGKGRATRLSTFGGAALLDTDCAQCGSCVAVCPTGALRENWRIREGEGDTLARSICTYCGTGCGIVAHVKKGRIVGVEGDPSSPVSQGDLCVKGRFALDFVHHRDRLTTPLIRDRKGGALRKASWAEALNLTARKLSDIRKRHGPDAIAGVSSSRCSNEENYLMGRFMRAVIGTNNVDNCARVCHAPSVTGLAAAFGSGAATNSLEEITGAMVIFLVGSNTEEAHPVVALKIKKALRAGAKLIVADSRRTRLAAMADVFLPLKPGTNVALAHSILNVLIEEGLTGAEFIAGRTVNFEVARRMAEQFAPERADAVTGVRAEDIRRAARLYASSKKAMLLYGLGVTEHTSGANGVRALANLVMATGAVGRPHSGISPLRGQNNVQGACDMGALPNVFPGYQPVDDRQTRARFEARYGVALPPHMGLKTTEYYEAAETGELRALLVMAMDPAATDPNLARARAAYSKLEFMAVMEIFMTDTAKLADVVFPAASFAEKEGTFTNAERRVQLFGKIIEPLKGTRPDWRILLDLAERMGAPMPFESPARIWDEVAELTPAFAGISHERLAREGGLCWPCPAPDHPGTPVMYEVNFPNGLARFSAPPATEPHESPDTRYPFTLITGRRLAHYNNGSMTRRSRGLMRVCAGETLDIHPSDARKLRLRDGGWARVSSRRGSVAARVKVTDETLEGRVFMSFHFPQTPVNFLTSEAVDAEAGTPEYKVTAVRVERMGRK